MLGNQTDWQLQLGIYALSWIVVEWSKEDDAGTGMLSHATPPYLHVSVMVHVPCLICLANYGMLTIISDRIPDMLSNQPFSFQGQVGVYTLSWVVKLT